MSSAFTRLAQALASQKEPARIERFLLELLTPGETHDLGLRWELVELLVAGVSQRQISARLGISLCKITRGAKILKKRNGAVAELLSASPAGPSRSVKKTTAAAPAAKKAAAMKAAPKKAVQNKAEPKKPVKGTSGKKATAARKPVAKTTKKVGDRHGTRISGKSKNQVRR